MSTLRASFTPVPSYRLFDTSPIILWLSSCKNHRERLCPAKTRAEVTTGNLVG
ncbi:hypothetical protein ASPBRDRAFT_36261 [Aspergillus brasiliensis CBS 101740]|uniref:Uncharacterized protein n=1 Tax=Aspergillus brasiliensis (strain CBS 101740 / IMI 381727 / IBT 21946) TaxID=767769 RepID=A0A1L9UZF2_ASPBC|nr:hypothetical protein ASPBRDRAFT_36261 [Aspergillus brasiliensis CBS 101740]